MDCLDLFDWDFDLVAAVEVFSVFLLLLVYELENLYLQEFPLFPDLDFQGHL